MIEAKLLPQAIVSRHPEDVHSDILRLSDAERYNLYDMLRVFELNMLQTAMGIVHPAIFQVLNMLGAMPYASTRSTIKEYYDSLHAEVTTV